MVVEQETGHRVLAQSAEVVAVVLRLLDRTVAMLLSRRPDLALLLAAFHLWAHLAMVRMVVVAVVLVVAQAVLVVRTADERWTVVRVAALEVATTQLAAMPAQTPSSMGRGQRLLVVLILVAMAQALQAPGLHRTFVALVVLVVARTVAQARQVMAAMVSSQVAVVVAADRSTTLLVRRPRGQVAQVATA
jgi:hypothetical protein